MNCPLRIVLLVSLAIGVVLNAQAQEKLWVSSTGAKLKEAQKALSKTVAKVDKGTELTVLEAGGKWYRVATPVGDEGWIYRGKVSQEPPAAEPGSGGGGGLFGSVASSRIEAGASDTSRSIRGLSPETEAYANSAGTPAETRAALDKVLEIEVAEGDLEKFLQDGQIGEYAP